MNIQIEKEELVNNTIMEPEVLFENDDFIVINKPAGLVVHSDGKTEEKNLVDWLIKKYPEIQNVGESGRDSKGNIILRSGIVHRLDRETSGVMVVCKNNNSFSYLKKQFIDRKVSKKYLAIVCGELKNTEGVIDRPIKRSSSDFRKWTAQRGGRGEERSAETYYKVLKKGHGFTFLEVYPKTGRTHQIRVHLKAINHPLVGDSLYGKGKENELGIKRTALHSSEIKFSDFNGQNIIVQSPLPEDFMEALKVLQMA